MSRNYTEESCFVETSDNINLHTKTFKPRREEIKHNLTIILIHPYSVLGGCQDLLKGIATGFAKQGYMAVTFDMRGVGQSTGRSSLTGFQEIKDVIAVCNWVCQNLSSDKILLVGSSAALLKGLATGFATEGYMASAFDMRGVGQSTGRASLTGFQEIKEVIAVCNWVCQNLSTDRILLVGSSAGAPISGSAVDKVEQVIGYVGLGYPFGLLSSILFGRHYKAILQSPKPKLFVMGTRDGFTSVNQLKTKLKSAKGRVETHLVDGAGHFQLEGPYYDTHTVDLIVEFIESL